MAEQPGKGNSPRQAGAHARDADELGTECGCRRRAAVRARHRAEKAGRAVWLRTRSHWQSGAAAQEAQRRRGGARPERPAASTAASSVRRALRCARERVRERARGSGAAAVRRVRAVRRRGARSEERVLRLGCVLALLWRALLPRMEERLRLPLRCARSLVQRTQLQPLPACLLLATARQPCPRRAAQHAAAYDGGRAPPVPPPPPPAARVRCAATMHRPQRRISGAGTEPVRPSKMLLAPRRRSRMGKEASRL
jgi:hypothetical protein